jgi:hypothetical protein
MDSAQDLFFSELLQQFRKRKRLGQKFVMLAVTILGRRGSNLKRDARFRLSLEENETIVDIGASHTEK